MLSVFWYCSCIGTWLTYHLWCFILYDSVLMSFFSSQASRMVASILGLLCVVTLSSVAYAASDSASLRLDQGTVKAQIQQSWSHVNFQITSTASRSLACQIRAGSTTFAGLACSRSLSITPGQELSIYVQLGSSQWTLRYDTSRQRFVAQIDAGSTTTTPTPPSTTDRRSLALRVSPNSPRLRQSIDFSISTYLNGSLDQSNRDTLRFEILKYDGSRYIRASSLDYDLRSSTYRMTASDAWSVRIANALHILRSGRYKIRVSSSASSLQDEVVVSVEESSTSTPSPSARDYYSATISPRLPKLRQSIDLALQSYTSQGSILTHTDRIDIAIQRRLLPDSHAWTTLKTRNVCDLRQTTYRFVSGDRGATALYDLLSCSQKWFYRLEITNRDYPSVAARYVYFTILDERDFTSRPVPGFTTSQKQAIQDEYAGFMDQINQRHNLYPNLVSSTRRYDLWTNYYRELNKVTYNKDGKLTSYRAYQDLKDDFNRRMRLYR